jgi:ABC-type multidrug transport system ATPase subunit
MTCEQIIIIDRGEVAAAGELDELKRQHQNLEEYFVRLTEREKSSV